MSAQKKKHVDLGFAEDCDSVLLRNVYFPSKIGGKPAWLDLDAIPSTEELTCKKCGAPQSFLCQIYAPIEDDPVCFHRTIFLFICREASCFVQNSADNISAFRSQLPRENKFYSALPPDEDNELDAIVPSCKMCAVCGCRGAMMCSRCKLINYCSVKHQRAHWSQHKTACQLGKQNTEVFYTPLVTFPELEIVIEQEVTFSEGPLPDDEVAEKRRLDEFQALVDQGKAGTMNDVSESELKKYASDVEEKADACFSKFKKRTSTNPSQVLRYDLGGDPLWIADVNKTLGSVKVAPCKTCNSERQFEFQIMPQMVNFLEDDNIDWGVLAVYTCKKSCQGAGGYAREFILKQDIVPDDNN